MDPEEEVVEETKEVAVEEPVKEEKKVEYVTKEEFTDFKQETGSKLDAILEHTKPKEAVVKEEVVVTKEVSAPPPPKKEESANKPAPKQKKHWMYDGWGYNK